MEIKLQSLFKFFKKDTRGKVVKIPISSIIPNPYQPRKKFSEASLLGLAKSIKEYGLIQPIVVRKHSNKKYQIVVGERRFRAYKMAGFEKIPALIRESSEKELIEMAFLENLQRENLSQIEEAESYDRLKKEFEKLTIEELAERVGKPSEEIRKKIDLISLPMLLRKAVEQEIIDIEEAFVLSELKDEKLQLKVLEKVNKGMSPAEVEKLVRKLKDEKDAISDDVLDERILEIEEEIIWVKFRKNIEELKNILKKKLENEDKIVENIKKRIDELI